LTGLAVVDGLDNSIGCGDGLAELACQEQRRRGVWRVLGESDGECAGRRDVGDVESEWDVLGFELVDGRHADYRPGSPDLPQVTAAMAALGTIQCPDLPVKRAEHRWRTYVADPQELDLLKGDRLLHTDYNPLNVLMAASEAKLIDWAWPTRGAGWIDPACLILRLIANGHSAASSEQVAADVPAWRAAPKNGVAVFAQANVKMWEEIASSNPMDWTHGMARAARAWAAHREAV
jgi:hypothetical protein